MNRRNFLGFAMVAPLVPIVAAQMKATPERDRWNGFMHGANSSEPELNRMSCWLKSDMPWGIGRKFDFDGATWRVIRIEGLPRNGWRKVFCEREDPSVWADA